MQWSFAHVGALCDCVCVACGLSTVLACKLGVLADFPVPHSSHSSHLGDACVLQLKRQEEGLRNAEATTPLLAGRGRAASQGSANAPRTASRKPVGAATEKSRLLEEGHAAANGVSVEDAMPPLSPLWQVSHIGPMVLIASGVVFMLMGVSVTTLKLVGALPQD